MISLSAVYPKPKIMDYCIFKSAPTVYDEVDYAFEFYSDWLEFFHDKDIF
jgi:hypothetical protein